jgi:anti-sigma-K factor RskA
MVFEVGRMMKDSEHQELIAQALAGKLTPAEQGKFDQLLTQDSAFQALWQEELGLNRALGKLPNAVLSSNFTARVIQAARAQDRVEPQGSWKSLWAGWLWSRGLATAAVALGVGILGVNYHRAHQRQELAAELKQLTPLASVLAEHTPDNRGDDVELLKNFDVIQSLAYVPGKTEVDTELLAALEK